MFGTFPQDRTGRGFCFRNRIANILQLQIFRAPLRRTSDNMIMVFQSCLTTWAEPDRGIVGLCELEFVGSDGLPILSDGVRDYTSQSMTMLSPSFCVWRSDSGGDRIHRHARKWRPHTARDPGSLNRYADSLSIHMRSIILGLGLTGVEEIIIGDAVHIDSIPQSSIGEYLAW